MQYSKLTLALALVEFFGQSNAGILSSGRRSLDGGEMLKRATATVNGTQASLCLDPSAIATGSEQDGQNPPIAGQASSAT